MKDFFLIYIDRLKDQKIEHIDNHFPSDFLDVKEKSLRFVDLIHIKGKVYTTSTHLILQFDTKTFATIPCSVCNQETKILIEINNFYYTKTLSMIKGAIFDFRNCLREAILLDIPAFAECHQGNCTERKNLKSYTTKNEKEFYPFSKLD